MRVIRSIEDAKALEGVEVGLSDWVVIDQNRIDQFAEATGDYQWIHVDTERAAAEMPDGKTIAHGYLTLALIPSLTGEVWVMRPGDSLRLEDCVEDPIEEGAQAAYERPCWDDERIIDVFGADGRYLGEVDSPDDSFTGTPNFVVDGERVVAVVQDEAGVYRVKRYRLVAPAEGGGQ